MSTGCAKYCLTGEEYGFDEIEHIEIKSGAKRICKDCVIARKGII